MKGSVGQVTEDRGMLYCAEYFAAIKLRNVRSGDALSNK